MSETPAHSAGSCPNCGSLDEWGAASWCPNCGYYPELGSLMEQTSPAEPEVEYDHWWQSVPEWIWALGTGLVGIFVVSLAVRLHFAESPVRGLWCLGQLALGLLTFSIAHATAFLYGCFRDASVGPLDLIIKPWGAWTSVFRALPKTDRLVCSGGWGLFSAVMAITVIGGLDYEQIFIPSQQFLQRHRAGLLQKTVGAAQAPAAEMDMDEALDEFAKQGSTAINQWGTETARNRLAPADPGETDELARADRPKIECVVFGYTTNEDGDLRSLLLAALTTPTRLQFVCKLSVDDVPPDVLEDMARQFPELITYKRLVPCPYNARWLKPQVYCTVTYAGWSIQGLLKEAQVIPPSSLIHQGLPRIIEQPVQADKASRTSLSLGLN